MAATARFKRFVLRILQDECQDEGKPLSEVLKELRKSRWSQIQGGQIRATAGNGHSVEFSAPGDFTQLDAAELSSEFSDLYDWSATSLQAGTSSTQPETIVASPSDEEIFAEMFQRLSAVRFIRSDFSLLDPHR